MYWKTLFLFFLLASGLPLTCLATQIDINHADARTLATGLTGIGQSKADAIIAYRATHPPFRAANDLLKIKGIGHAIIEKNQDRLRFVIDPKKQRTLPTIAP